MKKYKFLLILLICLIGSTYAQHPQQSLVQELKVGDMVPQFNATNRLFDTDDKLDLNNDTRILILDFFDTYCTACIAALPKLKKLQEEHLDKLQIVLVTWQNKETITRFWDTNKFIKEHQIDLPILYGDTILNKYFPHKSIPHAAWIYKGVVQAVTYSDFIIERNITDLFADGHIHLPLKNDFESQANELEHDKKSFLSQITYSGFQDGRPPSSYTYKLDSLSGYFKTSSVNQPIFSTYVAVWSKIKTPQFIISPHRIEWDVADSTLYKNFGDSGTGRIWLSKNGICYERFDKEKVVDSIQAKRVLADLNNLLNLEVFWAKRKRKTWVIKGKYRPVNVKLEGQEIEGTGVLAFVLDFAGKYPITIDQVNSKNKFILPSFNSLKELNQKLKMCGLKVVERKSWVDVLVFKENK
ncbi:hypothetical protein GEO21_03490 [Sphingobacterium faecium]|uniref:TlpA family protein disulfide reductase n=1 Tax=Sphingobacterium faecium TaxID=34087 RepID=UPI001291A7A3|nr:hypothetical protein [Sphingobacterium faecium]MQP26578.1 hypothetical protein [Sphingobacterium faecium]